MRGMSDLEPSGPIALPPNPSRAHLAIHALLTHGVDGLYDYVSALPPDAARAPAAVIPAVAAEAKPIWMADDVRDLSFLGLAEHMRPSDVVQILNQYGALNYEVLRRLNTLNEAARRQQQHAERAAERHVDELTDTMAAIYPEAFTRSTLRWVVKTWHETLSPNALAHMLLRLSADDAMIDLLHSIKLHVRDRTPVLEDETDESAEDGPEVEYLEDEPSTGAGSSARHA